MTTIKARRVLCFIGFGLLVAALAGCGPPWKVLKESSPPAIKGKASFAVVADFGGMMVGGKSEAEYLAEKDEDAKANFAGDKDGMTEHFIKELSGAKGISIAGDPASADVVVTVKWVFVEPGVYTAVFNKPTTVTARVSFAVGGEVMDEIEITYTQQADIYHPSSGQRMRNCAEEIGAIARKFINEANKDK